MIVVGGSARLEHDDEGGEITRHRIADAGTGTIEVDGETRRWKRL